MMLDLLATSTVRSTLLGLIVGSVLVLLRVKRPDARMAVWSVVLSVAVVTPVLTPWMKISIPVSAPPLRTVRTEAPTFVQGEPTLVSPQFPLRVLTISAKHHSIYSDWRMWVIALYAAGVGVMLLRIAFGLILTALLVRESRSPDNQPLNGLKVRESSVLKSPATFGSTIFLPAEYRTWSDDKRRAVLLHEGSHVANRDFYVLIVASLYRVAFWFNPFAWWLESRLTDLAEMVADDAAARGLGDRRRYAEILTDLARRPHRLHAGLAMAAPGAVEWRVQRQLAAALPSDAVDRGQRLVIASIVFPLAILSATTVTRTVVPKAGGYLSGVFTNDAGRALAIKLSARRRAATAPERFLSQSPLRGGEAALREELMSLCCGAQPYRRIGAPLAGRLNQPNSGLRHAVMRFGAPKELSFMGVGPGAYDIYDVQFERGSAAARIDIAPDGTFEDLALSPNGDDTPGSLASCAQETSLVPSLETVLISLTFVNRSGGALNLFDLGELGRREHQVALPDGGRTSLWRGVQNPLLVSDAAGRCLGIVLPGKSTRSNFIGPGGVLNVVRQTAFPGGADFLKQYLDGVRRGAVAYDRMTPEAAAILQSQQEHRRAILEKLGMLVELRFKRVTRLEEDVYRTRFSNGSCEWHISFGEDGRVSDIELGPDASQNPS